MRFGNVGGGRRKAGADGPDRLVGDHGIVRGRGRRHRAGDLARQDVECRAELALGPGLADADDGDDAGAPCGFRLGAHDGVGLAVVGAALGVADDDMRGAGVLQHLGRDVAGVRAALLRVAVLAADLDRRGRQHLDGTRQQRGGRADQRVGLGVEPAHEAVPDGAQLVQRRACAVHLPVAGDQGRIPGVIG